MFDLDAMPGSLLTEERDNTKTAKSKGHGYLTAIMHLAPEMVSGRNVCPHATRGCAAACLNTAGRGGLGLDSDGLNSVQVARIRRTRWFHRDREGFMVQLEREIRAHVRRAERKGLLPAVRLNGTSDLPWERLPITRLYRKGKSAHRCANVFQAFPRVTFYDYTKWPARLRERVADIPNYSLTFSMAEDNDEHAAAALAAGMNVAVVFDVRRSGGLPPTFMGAPVVDGDISDLRFLDPAPVIVGLRAKGRAKTDRSGFVRSAQALPMVGR